MNDGRGLGHAALHRYIEEDLQKFEETEQETQERLQAPSLNEKEVEQLKKDTETFGESLAFLGLQGHYDGKASRKRRNQR